MSRLRRTSSALAVIALLATMLVAVPVAADEPTAAEQLAKVATEAATRGDHGAKAASRIAEALDPALWVDGNALGDDGKKVFDGMKKATKELIKAEAGDLVAQLVDVATGMAAGQIAASSAAGATGKHIDKANESMAKAASKMKEGKPGDAIKQLLKAWKEAAKALDQMNSGGSDGSGGKYAEYEVVFVHRDTVDSETPVFITLRGTNESGTPGYTGRGNEGYIFSPEFGASDSFHGSDLVYRDAYGDAQGMQLHVSCSDAFPGGFGAKSDPSMDSGWLVNSMTITKYSNGQVDKTCGIMGVGLPVVDPVIGGGDDSG